MTTAAHPTAAGDAAPRTPPAAGGGVRPEAGRGHTEIDEKVVERVASQALTELPRAGIDGAQRVKATVDGHLTTLRLTLSVTYPESIRRVTRRVRDHLTARVGELTGLEVREVDIDVARLVPPAERRREVL